MPGFATPTDLSFRPAKPADLEALTDIYNHYVLKTTATMDIRPVRAEERRGWLDDHRDTGPYRLIVAEGEGRVLGYACTRIYRIVASVCLPNPSSVRLHERFGFTLVGVFHEIGRKFDRYVDVAWYERPLVAAPETRA